MFYYTIKLSKSLYSASILQSISENSAVTKTQNSYVLMKLEQARQNGIGARGATKSKRALSTIGEKSEPTNGGGAPETLLRLCGVESTVAAHPQYFKQTTTTTVDEIGVKKEKNGKGHSSFIPPLGANRLFSRWVLSVFV